MSSNENLSLRFAEQLIALGRSTLSAPDSEQIRRLMLDALGVMLRGSGLPLSLSMRDWAKQFSQSGQAPVVAGGFTTAPAVAALVNATATHSYELDDTHDASMSHPGSVVIATALAMVAGTSISQAKLFSAIAAGYETIARVGMAANASLVIKAGFKLEECCDGPPYFGCSLIWGDDPREYFEKGALPCTVWADDR